MKLLALVVAYLLGGIPFGFLLFKLKTGGDIRAAGSGNIGATNVHRTAGKLFGVLTLVLDAAKGIAALWIMRVVAGHDTTWLALAAIAVMLGFKGGKGVATFVGTFLFLTPAALLATALVFFVAVGLTRYISLGSVLGAIVFPLAVWLVAQPPLPVFFAALVCSGLVLWRHRENIDRLRADREHAFRWGGRGR
jgi:glycerol-3-phosphate acyltransferase PlsY